MMAKPIWYEFSSTSQREDNRYYNPEHIVWWKLQDGQPVYENIPDLSRGFYGSDQDKASLDTYMRKITSDRYDHNLCYRIKLLMTDGIFCKTVTSHWIELFEEEFDPGIPPDSIEDIWSQRRDTTLIDGKLVYFEFWKMWFYDKELKITTTTRTKGEVPSIVGDLRLCLSEGRAPVSLGKAQMSLSYVDPKTGDCHYREIYIKNSLDRKEFVNVFVRPYIVHRSRYRNHPSHDFFFMKNRWTGLYRRSYFGTINDVYDFNRMRDKIASLAVSIHPQFMF